MAVKRVKVSNNVIRRLPRYLRKLDELSESGVDKISSRQLGEQLGLTSSQVRQDFNCFGEFGQQGYGYNVSELRTEIGKILGLDSLKPMILLGAGNLGSAIAAHLDFKNRGFERIGIFDANKSLVGKEIGELKVTDIEELEDFCKERSPEAAILCIPKDAAVTEAEILISYGIKAFWNFTHYDLKMAYKDVIVENVHLGDSLTTLSYCINSLDKS